MATKIKAIIEFGNSNYSAYLPEVNGYVGVGDTVEDVKQSLQENIEFTLEGLEEDGFDIPNVFKGEWVLEYSYDLTTFLQVYGKILSKSGLERITGINQKQLFHYASGMKKPRPATVKKVSDAVHKLASDLQELQFV